MANSVRESKTVLTAEDRASQVFKQFSNSINDVKGSITGLQGGLVALGAAVGVIAFAKMVEDVAKARAELERFSQSGLGSVDDLGKLKAAARLSGEEFGNLTGAMSKMLRGLAGSDKETSKAADALSRIGISARDAAGKLKEPAALMLEMAPALAKYADGADKAIILQAILGKGGEQYAHTLKIMAETQDLQSKTTKLQAVEAEAFEVAQIRLTMATEGVAKKIAGEAIPAGTALIQTFTDLITGSSGLKNEVNSLAADGSLQDWFGKIGGYAIELASTILILGANIGYVFKQIGDSLGGTAAQLVAFTQDGVRGWKTVGDAMHEQELKNRADLDATEKKLLGMQDKYQQMLAANKAKAQLEAGADGRAAPDSSGLGTVDKPLTDRIAALQAYEEAVKKTAAAAEDAAYAIFKAGIQRQISDLSALNGAKLLIETDYIAQVQGLKQDEVAKNIARLTNEIALEVQTRDAALARAQEAVAGSAEELKILTQVESAKQRLIKKESELTIALQDRISLNRDYERQIDLIARKENDIQLTVLRQYEDIAKAHGDETDALKLELDLLGKTPSQIAAANDARKIEIKLREDLLALQKQAAEYEKLNGQSLPGYQDAADRLKAQAAAQIQANAGLRDQIEAQKESLGIQDRIASSFGTFFSDLVFKGRSAFDSLKQSMKSFFAELLAALAKRYILNIVTGGSGGYGQIFASALGGGTGGGGGGLTGLLSSGSSLNSAYNTVAGYFGGGTSGGAGAGANVWAGAGYGDGAVTAGGGAGGTSGLGAVGTLGAVAGGALIGYGVGAAVSKNPNNSGAIGGAVGGAGGAYLGATYGASFGPIGIVVGAVLGALVGAFAADRGRPKVEGGYIGQYDASGKEVRSQFERVYTSNSLDETFKPVAQTFANRYIELIGKLGGKATGFTFSQGVDTDPGGTAQNRISTRLLDANGNQIFHSRDREIGRDNKDIDKNIALDVARAMLAGLQQADLPKQVHDILMGGNALTGTVEEIDKFVAAALEMQNVLTALSTTTIKGLTIDTLQQFQAQGESIGQTYARVTGAFDALNNVFATGDDKIRNSQAALQTIFDSVGVTLPNSIEGFKALIASIDVSTESGRGLFNLLSQTAPAFKAVQDAVAQMIDSFNQSVGTIAGPDYQRALITNQLNGVVDSWIRLTNSTFTRQQTIDYIRTAAQNADATLAYAAQFGPEGTRLISEMFRLFASLQTTSGGGGSGGGITPVDMVTRQFEELARIAAELAKKLQDAKDGLNDYLRGSKLSELSPLTTQQKYDEVKAQLDAQVARAQGGDVSAFSGLGNLRDTFLGLSRQLFGSGGAYNNDYLTTFDRLNTLGGNQVDRPYTAADSRTQTNAIITQLRENNTTAQATNAAILGLLNLISNGVETSDPRMIELTEEIKRNTKAGSGSLTSSPVL